MNNIQIFKNDSFGEVRTVTIEGEPWFVAKDICDKLELSDVYNTLKRVDIDDTSETSVTDSIGRKQLTKIINESGLYSIIFQSNKPEARTFKKWITSEVIPAIRKTGSYSFKNSQSESKTTLELSQMMWDSLRLNDNSKLSLGIKLFEHYKLPTVALPVYTKSVDCLKSITELLKIHNRPESAIKFNKLLEEAGIIEKKSRPSRKIADKIKEFWSLTEKGKQKNLKLKHLLV